MSEYSVQHVSGPSAEPVTVAEMLPHLNMGDVTLSASETADLLANIRAARLEAEAVLGKKIGPQQWDVTYDAWVWWDSVAFPIGPLISVDSVVLTDETGTETVVDPSLYGFSAPRGMMWLNADFTWPSTPIQTVAGIRFRVTVGIKPMSIGSPVEQRYPDNIRKAIMFRAATFWNLREDMTLGTTMQAGKVGTFEALLSGDKDIRP